MTFSPTAWAQLLFLRDLGPTEVGMFGLTSPDNLLAVEALAVPRQRCTEVTVAFDDHSVADLFDDQVEQGRRPDQFARIWIHTHPGDSAAPSSTDLETFTRCFGGCDWAAMVILAQGGARHAQLHLRLGDARLPLQVEIDYSRPFAATRFDDWAEEYRQQVIVPPPQVRRTDTRFWNNVPPRLVRPSGGWLLPDEDQIDLAPLPEEELHADFDLDLEPESSEFELTHPHHAELCLPSIEARSARAPEQATCPERSTNDHL